MIVTLIKTQNQAKYKCLSTSELNQLKSFLTYQLAKSY